RRPLSRRGPGCRPGRGRRGPPGGRRGLRRRRGGRGRRRRRGEGWGLGASRWLTIALPKGRLAAEAAELIAAAGLGRGLDPGARTLIHEEPSLRLRFAWLRPADALTYVERGVAALAFVGKDVLVERQAAVDEV